MPRQPGEDRRRQVADGPSSGVARGAVLCGGGLWPAVDRSRSPHPAAGRRRAVRQGQPARNVQAAQLGEGCESAWRRTGHCDSCRCRRSVHVPTGLPVLAAPRSPAALVPLMTPESEYLARRLGNAVTVARWLGRELASEKHPLAHVCAQLVAALTDLPVGGCRGCGDPLPAPQRTGRPRVLCLVCSPRKTQENKRVVA